MSTVRNSMKFIRLNIFSQEKYLKDNKIRKPYFIAHPENFFIGTNNKINRDFYVVNRGKVTIGNDNIISERVVILTNNHLKDPNRRKANPDLTENKEVKIGNNNWIGFGVIICPGVVIGDNCIIGAGAVVRGKHQDNSLIV